MEFSEGILSTLDETASLIYNSRRYLKFSEKYIHQIIIFIDYIVIMITSKFIAVI